MGGVSWDGWVWKAEALGFQTVSKIRGEKKINCWPGTMEVDT